MPLSEREEQEARDTRFEGITMPSQIFSKLYSLLVSVNMFVVAF